MGLFSNRYLFPVGEELCRAISSQTFDENRKTDLHDWQSRYGLLGHPRHPNNIMSSGLVKVAR